MKFYSTGWVSNMNAFIYKNWIALHIFSWIMINTEALGSDSSFLLLQTLGDNNRLAFATQLEYVGWVPGVWLLPCGQMTLQVFGKVGHQRGAHYLSSS